MEERKIIQAFVKSRLALNEEWWFDFLIGAALAEFSCDSYIVEEETTESEVLNEQS